LLINLRVLSIHHSHNITLFFFNNWNSYKNNNTKNQSWNKKKEQTLMFWFCGSFGPPPHCWLGRCWRGTHIPLVRCHISNDQVNNGVGVQNCQIIKT